MAHSQHDELATMFAQHMNFAPSHQDHGYQRETKMQQNPSDDPVYYASSHYAHTAHIRIDNNSEASSSPPSPYHENQMPEALAQVFRDHSINPNALLQNQVHLFANADHEQRLRLLELWRISPPSYPFSQHLSSVHVPTSMDQEIAQAKDRYEARLQQHYEPEAITPIREAGEPAFPPAARMRAASIASSRPQTRHGIADAEPYMMAGYQSVEPRRSSAVDPVYAAASGLWQSPNYAHAQSVIMEEQGASYQQIRNHADWEAMNERIARERLAGVPGGGDDDMEL